MIDNNFGTPEVKLRDTAKTLRIPRWLANNNIVKPEWHKIFCSECGVNMEKVEGKVHRTTNGELSPGHFEPEGTKRIRDLRISVWYYPDYIPVDTEDINERIEESYKRGLKDGLEGLKGEE
jgi:hypothetical protein